jgi:hypothetical protein
MVFRKFNSNFNRYYLYVCMIKNIHEIYSYYLINSKFYLDHFKNNLFFKDQF